MDDLLTGLASSSILKTDIWQSADYTPPPVLLSVDQQRAFRDVGLFQTARRVVSYDTDEVVNSNSELVYKPLWQHCTDLLSGGFFTLPLQNNALPKHLADAVRQFNPATESSSNWHAATYDDAKFQTCQLSLTAFSGTATATQRIFSPQILLQSKSIFATCCFPWHTRCTRLQPARTAALGLLSLH